MDAKSLLKGMGHLVTKMNITFFKGNVVLNIFLSNSFFERGNIFRENSEKNLGGDKTIF